MTSTSEPDMDLQRADDTCLRCREPVASLGVAEFRVGGTSGGWKPFFGQWAELGEGILPLEVFGCDTCGHVELRRPGFGPTPDATDQWAQVWRAHDRR
jgi:hypothetical protein